MSQGSKTTENTAVNRLIDLAQGNKPLQLDEDLFSKPPVQAPPKGKASSTGKQIPPPFRNTGITAVVAPLPRPSAGFPAATPAPELRADPSTGPLELSELEEVSPSPPAQAPRLAALPPMTADEQSWFDPTQGVEKYDDVDFGTEGVRKQRGSNAVWYVVGAFGLGLALAAVFFWPRNGSAPETKKQSAPTALAAGVVPLAPESEAPPAAPPQPTVEPMVVAPAPEVAPIAEAVPAPTPPPEPLNPNVRFESSPPGAKVVLVLDGDMIPLGPSPVERTLELGRKYEVMFTLEGHASLIVPVEGGTAERIAASMGEATSTATIVKVAAAPAPVVAEAAPVETVEPVEQVVEEPAPAPAPKKVAAAPKKKVTRPAPAPAAKKKVASASSSGGSGTLKIGAKPPCEVYVDGKKVGTSPIANLSVSAGKHKLTLINREYGIKESVSVTVDAGDTVKVVKDLTRKMK